jgi:hypothetical protein
MQREYSSTRPHRVKESTESAKKQARRQPAVHAPARVGDAGKFIGQSLYNVGAHAPTRAGNEPGRYFIRLNGVACSRIHVSGPGLARLP